jgi:hypothetical protein
VEETRALERLRFGVGLVLFSWRWGAWGWCGGDFYFLKSSAVRNASKGDVQQRDGIARNKAGALLNLQQERLALQMIGVIPRERKKWGSSGSFLFAGGLKRRGSSNVQPQRGFDDDFFGKVVDKRSLQEPVVGSG